MILNGSEPSKSKREVWFLLSLHKKCNPGTFSALFTMSALTCTASFPASPRIRAVSNGYPGEPSLWRRGSIRSRAIWDISLVDSTPIAVCENLRIPRHRGGLEEMAERGKNSMGGFFGFKLHWVINPLGEWLGVKRTPGNVDDRKPVRNFADRLFGRRYATRATSLRG